MKRLLLFIAFAVSLFGQGTTCQQQTNFTSATTSQTLDNRLRILSPACDVWRLDYYSTGLSALSISIQGAPDSSGSAGTWVDIASTAVMYGSNPSTGLQGQILLRSYYPWVRVNVGTFTTTGTIYTTLSGQNALSVSPPVTASISGTVAATQSGAWSVGQTGVWTVQPGNTPNTTPWKVDGSAVTQPVSAAALPLPTGAATAAKQAALGTAGTPSADVYTVQGVASMTPLQTDLTKMGGTTITFDPCFGRAKSVAMFSLTANTQILTGTASNKTYICGIQIVTGAATNIAIVEGTGSVCATSTVQLFGGATAATGWNFAANGGLTAGGSNATIAVTTVNANNICLFVSAANQTTGSFSYVTAP